MDTIAGTSNSILTLLERQFIPVSPGLPAFNFRVFRGSDFANNLMNTVSLFLYRVDVDPTRRHIEIPDLEGSGERFSLGLELQYLLTVWGQDPKTEQRILERCIHALDENAILSGDQLVPGFGWENESAVKLTLISLSNEDMLRLWDAFPPAYRLSVAYSARTIRLDPIAREQNRIVESVTRIGVPRIPPPELRR